jgi:predicted ATPase/DNA-binding CsgD family transcriptional regulator
VTKQMGNLPAEVSSFVDRRRERIELKRLLSTSRLVTVTGVGGVGKTRTTLRVAAEVRKGFTGGAWWVELSALRDGRLLPEVVAEGLGLRDQTSRHPETVLAEYLAPQRLLLVLDGCEHLVDACAALAHMLLRAAPGLRMLVTSRQALGVDGEHLFALSPLPVPPEGRRDRAAEPHPGVELFLERAQAAAPWFALTEENRAVVGQLCRRLDGIPLAIELAAGRLRVLPVQDIVSRLDDRFLLLTGGHRGRPARHETLRTAIDWSYQLCSPHERLLWARVSVFPGDFDLVAVREVCADGELPACVMLDLVSGLVEKSILLRDDHPTRARYRLLDTLREYGQARQSGDRPVWRRGHRDYYLRLARQCEAQWCGPDQVAWYQRITAEQPNIRAALEYCLSEPGELQVALVLAAALTPLWVASGSVREGRHYLERALALGPEPSPARTWALVMCAWLAAGQGDLDAVEAKLAECRPYAGERQDTAVAGWIAYLAAVRTLFRGDLAGSVALSKKSIELHRHGDDPGWGLVVAFTSIAMALTFMSEFDQAISYAEQHRELCERYGEQWMRSYADGLRAMAELGRGEVDAAMTYARESLRFKRQLGDSVGVAILLETLATADVTRGGAERAAHLLGSAEKIWPTVGVPRFGSPTMMASHQQCAQQARDRLGERAYRVAFQAGADLDLDSAVAYALDEQRPAVIRLVGWAPLTRREREIAEFVAGGLTNQEIATGLVISKRTADSHVHHILTKLGLANRAQIATWVAERRT